MGGAPQHTSKPVRLHLRMRLWPPVQASEAEATEWNRLLLGKGLIDVALRLTITHFDPDRLASS